MSDIFISYSHKDADAIARLVPAFEAEGFSVWSDHAIEAGETWDGKIAEGLREAKACVVVWSANSLASDWVKDEAEVAKRAAKYVPLLIGTEMPPLGFGRVQAANLHNWSGDTQDIQWRLLIKAIRKRVNGESAAERPDVPNPNPAPVSGAVPGAVATPFPRSIPGPIPAPAPPAKEDVGQAQVAISKQTSLLLLAAVVAGAIVWGVVHHLGSGSVVGHWTGWVIFDADPSHYKNMWSGNYQADGTLVGTNAAGTGVGQYTQKGSTVVWNYNNTTLTGTVDGNTMKGVVTMGAQRIGSLEAHR
jgi:hypothetical protein